MNPSGFRAAVRFHLETGVRVVLGLGPLQLVAAVAVVATLPQPLEALRITARGVADGTLFPGAGIGLAGLALLLSARGRWPFLLAAAACLGMVEWQGHLSLVRAEGRRQVAELRRPETILTRISWAALGPSVAAILLQASIPLAFAFLVLRNNPGITPAEAAVAVRGGCGLGVPRLDASRLDRIAESRTGHEGERDS